MMLGVLLTFGGALFAQESTADSAIGAANTAWIMTATALVLFMTLPGLALFYGGLVAKKNVLSVLMHCFAMACVLTIVWLVAGYSMSIKSSEDWAFGKWVGDFSALFGKGLTDADSGGAGIPDILEFAFQMTFFIITPALVVGTFVERVKFKAVVLFAILWSLLCYAPICHMVWFGGWMSSLNGTGVIDLAGGVVVHITAGVAALVFCVMLGRRKNPVPPHNLTMCFIGTCMLWVGWFGFNGGSGLAANGAGVMAIVVTHISASAGALMWMFLDILTTRKPTVLGICTGAIAGLAAITPASGVAGPLGGLLIGLVSGLVCWIFSIKIKELFKYDDSLDVVGVHGVGGLVGTILAAVVALPLLQGNSNGAGDEYNMMAQLMNQLIACGFTIVYTLVVTVVICLIIKFTVGLRVTEEQETIGLDQSSHGESGYVD